MAEFQEVANEIKRMCNRLKCSECPLGSKNTLANGICTTWALQNSEKAESIVMQWAAEHPIKTNRMKFEEVFGCDIITHKIYEAIPGHMKILNTSDAEFEEWLNSEYKEEQE